MHRTKLTLAAITAALLLGAPALSACSDPAADVEAASVEAPSAQEPPEEAPSEEAPANAEASSERIALTADNTRVGFIGAKVTASHEGGFRQLSGSVQLHSDALTESQVEVTLQAASLYIDNPRLENHLKSADFFDVARFPTASFRSTGIAEGGTGEATHTITGDLELHGQTQRISFPARVAVTAERLTAEAEFSINRHDFGITYPGMAEDLIRDGVVIKLSIDAARE